MSLYEYIALNNSHGANDLLGNYGFKATDSIDKLIDRLKMIVRKYKKIALQDISEIHPDKDLLSSFTISNSSDKEFAYATGRTPGFEEPIVEVAPEEPTFEPPPKDPFVATEVIAEIKDVKKQILKDKVRREINERRRRRERNRRTNHMGSMQNSPMLLLAVGFAVGYIIAKK
mgnify:CR=1 FL=1|tara:strand:- start:1060 stop:1578 length:519 start_codon:yes stop_codon:yes gene_type:complete